jgi:hypothetical protein
MMIKLLPLTNQGLLGEDGAAYSALVESPTSAPIGDYTLQGIVFGWDLEDSSYSPADPQFTTDVAFLILDFYNFVFHKIVPILNTKILCVKSSKYNGLFLDNGQYNEQTLRGFDRHHCTLISSFFWRFTFFDKLGVSAFLEGILVSAWGKACFTFFITCFLRRTKNVQIVSG